MFNNARFDFPLYVPIEWAFGRLPIFDMGPKSRLAHQVSDIFHRRGDVLAFDRNFAR